MTLARTRDHIWIAICLLSLFAYLLQSEAVRRFGSEFARLAGKL